MNDRALVAAAVLPLAAAALAQPMTYTSHTGQTTVYCGAPTGGPLVQHNYTTLAPAHDSISVSDPGIDRAASNATATIDSDPSPGGLSIAISGNSSRGPLVTNGAYATADSRDAWTFTLAQPSCFTLVVTLSGTGAGSLGARPHAFNFVTQSPGQIDLAGGPSVLVLTRSEPLASTWTQTYTGSLRPGTYTINIFSRSEGNTHPFAGTYDCSLHLTVGADTPVSTVSPASVCLDDVAEFAVTTTGAGPFTYQWQAFDPSIGPQWRNCTNGQFAVSGGVVANISGATSPTLQWTTLAGGEHRLRCVVTSPCGTTTSNVSVLAVKHPDLNDDGNSDQDDINLLISVIAGGPNPGFDPDINADGSVDQGDLDALLDWIGGGACP